MVELVSREECNEGDISFVHFEPQEAYVSIDYIKPLYVPDPLKPLLSRPLYLEQNEVNCNTEYTTNGITVCWANEQTFQLYDDAVACPKGVCVLDVSCPR